MRTLTFDCAKIEDEEAFRDLYLRQVDSEGAGYFGRNLDAFWMRCMVVPAGRGRSD